MKSRYFGLFNSFERSRKKIFTFNPVVAPARIEPEKSEIVITSYSADQIDIRKTEDADNLIPSETPGKISWINVDGLRKQDIEKIGQQFNIDGLLIEDILSSGQRPKMDEMENLVSTLLYMMYFNEESQSVETEQISIILGKNFVISFQENDSRDLFDPVRNKLSLKDSRLRNYKADYLFYSLIDIIVDNYFVILERLGEKIEALEDDIIRNATPESLARINLLRKEMLLLKRNITPVRELVNGILRTESELIDDRTEKYFKDIYDHIVQAGELSENYRDMMLNLHDLYLSELNLRMNEVMKVMAIVTCLLAPATVIGGIFGMNFSSIPGLNVSWGFYVAVAVMLVIPIWMIYIFKKRGWF